MTTIPPLRREVLVAADPGTAFEVFTARIGQWWPLAEHSVHGAGGTVAFSAGQIVEQSASGASSVWGTVTRWEPPSAVAFTWHPGRHASSATQVTVTFTAAGEQTLVTLEHAGWEAYAEPAAARAEYEHGWGEVLGEYRDHVAAGDGPDAESTWVALLHQPGPAAPAAASLVSDPRFGEHLEFLNRMRAAGYLVAAGPLTDADGEGMTILRLPGAGQFDRAESLATKDDTSVASGFLAVTVRPWQVVMQA